jgi:hypothetical protein
MTTVDLEFYLKKCGTLEREVRELLKQTSEMDLNQKRITLPTIGQLISRAKEYVSALEMEIADLTDQAIIDQYTQKKEEYRQKVEALDNCFREVNRSAEADERARAQGITPQDLMREATRLQDKQKKSLGNAKFRMFQIRKVGAETLDDMGHNREKLATSKRFHK